MDLAAWITGTLCLAALLAVGFAARHFHRKAKLLSDALDALDEGFALWDASDRLIHANRRYREIYADSAMQLKEGIDYAAHLRIRLQAPSAGVAPADREAYIQRRIDDRRLQRPPRDIEQGGGRWVRTIDRRTRDGSMVSVRVDVTDIKAREVTTARQAALLQSTFDNITDGLIVVDEKGRLVIWNLNAVQILGLPAELAQPGKPFRDILGFLAARGDFGQPAGDRTNPEAGILESVEARLDEGFTRTLQNERIVEIHRAAMVGGGHLVTLSDITRRVASTMAAATAHRRLVDAIESFPEGFAIFDSDDRLVTCNARYKEMYSSIAHRLVPGTSFEEQVRALAETDESLVDPEAVEAHVVDRMRRHRSPGEPLDVRRANGRWIRVIDRRTAEGGTVAIRIDVSDLRRRATVLTIVVETAQRLLVETRWQPPVEEMLARLGAALGISRTMLGRNKIRPNGKIVQKDVFEWDAPGVVRILGNADFDGFPIKDTAFQDWRLARSRGETVFGIVDDLDADKREWLGRQGVRSLIRVPVAVGGEWWGSVGFDHCRLPHRWEPLEIEAIQAAATLIGLAIQRNSANEKMERQRDALFRSEKMAAMGSLLAGVAHELNNPLAIVVGQAALLRETAREEKVLVRADKIAQAADRCARIVKTFLAMARQRPTERTAVHIVEIVRGTLDLLAYALRADGIAVDFSPPDDIPPVWGNADQLAQVVSNLVVNAQQAVRERVDERRIGIRIGTDPDDARRIMLRISDNGPGIPDDIKTRVFEPFFTTKPAGTGTGIGLSVCRGIVEAHDGTIAIDDATGGGAVFEIGLPVADPSDTRQQANGNGMREGLPSGISALVVDDEPDILQTLAEILGDAGAQVVKAGSGGEALAAMAAEDFDIVLCDMRMPDIDGPGLYRTAVAQLPYYADRFLFVTGDVLSSEVAQFLKQTGAPHIEKPFQRGEIIRAASNILGQP
ncbi:MAG: PAS-domain containing protein [Rhodospirillales bacterium]|nr:PAS-domain containing protein [Rhodospirillales bacterium]